MNLDANKLQWAPENLAEIIFTVDNHEDKSGRRKFDIVAAELADLPDDHELKRKSAQVLAALSGDLSKMDVSQARRLSRFIQTANISIKAIAPEYKRILRTSLQTKNDVEKRGIVLCMLSELGENSLPYLLKGETMLREKYPWLWIDAIESVDWPAAEKAIEETLAKEESLQDLRLRLPYFANKHSPLDGSLKKWLRLLPRDEREKLLEWIEARGFSTSIRAGVIDENTRTFIAAAYGLPVSDGQSAMCQVA